MVVNRTAKAEIKPKAEPAPVHKPRPDRPRLKTRFAGPRGEKPQKHKPAPIVWLDRYEDVVVNPLPKAPEIVQPPKPAEVKVEPLNPVTIPKPMESLQTVEGAKKSERPQVEKKSEVVSVKSVAKVADVPTQQPEFVDDDENRKNDFGNF